MSSWLERAVLFAILAYPLFYDSGLPLEVYLLLNGALVLLWLRRTHLLRDDSWVGWHWDLLVGLCGAWMALATVRNHHGSQALLAWETGALLAIYARRNYQRFFGHRFLLSFAATVLVFEASVCLAQYYAMAGTSSGQVRLAHFLGVDDPTRFAVGGGGVRVSRAVGTFLHANVLGGWIAMLLPFALYGFQAARREAQAVRSSAWLSLLLLSLTILLRTFARLAAVAGAAASAVFIVWVWLRPGAGSFRRRPSASAAVLLIPLAVAIAVGYATLGASGARGLTSIVRAKIADGRNETLVRLVLMRGALSALAERPLTGWGYPMGDQGMPDLGTVARQVSPEVERKYQRVGDAKVHVHNLFLIIALNGGVPALLFFLGALLWVCIDALAHAIRFTPEEVSIAAGLVAYLVMSLGYTVVHDQLWPLFLFLLGSLKAATALLPRGSARPARPRSRHSPSGSGGSGSR